MARAFLFKLILLGLVFSYSCALEVHVSVNYDSCSIEEGVSQGDINGNGKLPEASGIAYSRRTSGILWTFNDAGNDDRIYAISEQGDRLVDLSIEDTKNEDWEDIALALEDGVSYIYLSDTGNNDFDNENAR